jgi:hypothetical protein
VVAVMVVRAFYCGGRGDGCGDGGCGGALQW